MNKVRSKSKSSPKQVIHPEYIGKTCRCRAGKLGVVRTIRLQADGTVLYIGHGVGNIAQPWQSKHPTLVDE